MIYVMSDIHGCYEKFRKMLDEIRFSDTDTLYILGDVVDRGNDGITLLLDLMNRKNVVVLRGNHDYIAYRLLFSSLYPESITNPAETAEDFALWFKDGGKPTFDAFQKLTEKSRADLLNFINSFLIYEEIEVEERSFFLSHTIPKKEKMLNLDRCQWHDFVFGEPEYDKQYFDDRYIVTGHIPTGIISKEHLGKIYRADNHIAVDCGAGFGGPLGCIRLDDFAEYYAM